MTSWFWGLRSSPVQQPLPKTNKNVRRSWSISLNQVRTIRLKSLHYMSQVESLLSSKSVPSIPAPYDQTRPSENEKEASLLMVAAFRCVVSMVRTFWMSLTYLHFLEKDSTDRGPKKTFEKNPIMIFWSLHCRPHPLGTAVQLRDHLLIFKCQGRKLQ